MVRQWQSKEKKRIIMTPHLDKEESNMSTNVKRGLRPNFHTMLKKDLQEYMTGRCKHGHTYMSHPACYWKEKGKVPKIGFLDIETTGFEANYHFMLTWVIKTAGKKEYKYARITKKEILNHTFDKRITQELIDTLYEYDIIMTYYGTKFDVPFMRSRALANNLEFPPYNILKHKDVYYMVRRLLKLHRNTLDAATNFLGIKGKDHVIGDIWMKARVGDKASLDYVLEHNLKDCAILESLYDKLKIYEKGLKKSM